VRRVAIDEYLDVLHLRRLVETEAAYLACGIITKTELLDLRRRVEAMDDPSAITAAEHWALDDDIHLTIARGSGNQLLSKLVLSLRRRTRMFDLVRLPHRFEPGRAEHLAILDALIKGDGEAARECMRVHLENVKLSILKRLREF
jgi:DNA-binding GntR family transcriptional regulator